MLYVISASFISEDAIAILVTNIYGISERFTLIIKYLGNVADGDKDRRRGRPLPSTRR